MSKTLNIYNKLTKFPGGKWLFGKIICFKAPYFATIKPCFVELKPGYCEISFNKRRGVENHIKSVHAIAMANLCELAAGMLTEVSIPDNMRWIPINMNISYQHKAKTNVRGIATANFPNSWADNQDLDVIVSVQDTANTEVVKAIITMRISLRQ